MAKDLQRHEDFERRSRKPQRTCLDPSPAPSHVRLNPHRASRRCGTVDGELRVELSILLVDLL